MITKLIATDLDGTFWNDEKGFNEEKFDQLLQRLDDNDGHFVVSTGNDRATVDRVMAKFIGRFDYVVNNGAQIITKDNQTVALHQIGHDLSSQIYQMILAMDVELDHGVVFATGHAGYMMANERGVGRLAHIMEEEFPELQSIDAVTDISEEILKIILRVPEDLSNAVIDRLQETIGDLAHVTTSGYGAIDIVPANTNKAAGLATLAEYYALPLSELVAFGDGRNDLEMLRVATVGYAMPNGDQMLLNMFEAAVADNNHDGVLDTLLKS
ncbi:HAD-IIB family hydrolase [Weissella cibaria]|uniref:HAD-IIB family hydrolase n=1 Tax=Weissella cibaria TaxID=137591 RepID=UPI0036DC936B